MNWIRSSDPGSNPWPAIATTGLRVAFGLIWAVGTALVWSPDFASHYVGYLHNAAAGQPGWSAWWFDMWIAVVTPRVDLFVWLTRIIETALAVALLIGFARRSMYLLGGLFSLLIWSTAEGFAGPYAVGASNMGVAIVYVLLFAALIGLDYRAGFVPYSLDYLIERRWPWWKRIAEWSREPAPPQARNVLPWAVQVPSVLAVAVLLALLIAGLQSALNVKPASPATAAAAVSPLELASSEPISGTRDARLPPLIGTGDSVDVHLESTDVRVSIASGVDYNAWTFGNTVPGPTLHVREGQTVNVTYTNNGHMPHSIDFHAAMTAPSKNYVDIAPGETIEFSFVAETPGAFLYHCGTPPVLLHIANGMFGALIVSPKEGLPPASESYVLVQSEWYTRQLAGNLMGSDFEKMKIARPDEVVFNGAAFQYSQHPLPVTAGERVRVYFVNAGPNLWSAFHVIGGMFDKVYPSGNMDQALDGVSTYSVGPGEGAIFDLVLHEPGVYPFVDHSMWHEIIGAQGLFDVRPAGAEPAPIVLEEVRKPEPQPAHAMAPAQPEGPYSYDPARGELLYATNCGACHQASGKGMPQVFPPLVGNSAVLDPDPADQIRAILDGMQGEEVDGVVYSMAMPPFRDLLNDHEIADIINHERSSWGNQAKPVAAKDVKALRAD